MGYTTRGFSQSLDIIIRATSGAAKWPPVSFPSSMPYDDILALVATKDRPGRHPIVKNTIGNSNQANSEGRWIVPVIPIKPPISWPLHLVRANLLEGVSILRREIVCLQIGRLRQDREPRRSYVTLRYRCVTPVGAPALSVNTDH